MHIPILIPIPISTKYVASIKGAVWKFVSCSHCQQGYAYLLELEATAEAEDLLFLDGEGAKERARAAAEENLWHKSRNIVLPVPCPTCGWYQEDMQRNLQDGASINRLQIVGAVILALSLVPLAFSIPYLWVLTFVLAVVGVALLAYGYVVAFCFDPNAGDQEERKALGRKHAVWGEQLAELLATRPDTESNAAGGRGGPGTNTARFPAIE
jgi:hypothetical protein